MDKLPVVIIGAGAAGLMAAKKLLPFCNVVLLEAADRIGGRIHSMKQGTAVIEAGAEFVHGNLPLTLALFKEAGIAINKVEGEMYRLKNGSFTSVHEMTEGWETLMQKMSAVDTDTTMQSFLEVNFAGSKYKALRDHVKNYAEGFDLADMQKVSVKSLYEEWSAEQEDNYRIPGGYSTMIDHLHQQVINAGGKVITGSVVTNAKWEKNNITVSTGNKSFTARKLLVTVPVSLLQKDSKSRISFSPDIEYLQDAADQIGYGQVIKIVLHFSKAFWQADAGFILSDEEFPAWWTQLPNEAPIITGWIGGSRADDYINKTDGEILNIALQSLANMYSKPINELRELLSWQKVFNWSNVPFSSGGYSYLQPGSYTAIEQLLLPIENTLFFAGEAIYKGRHPGTVEAALESGDNAAAAIIKSL